LDTHLGIAKQRRWERYILDDQFHISTADEYHACRVCHTTPLPNTGTCDLCQRHADIGRKLPHTTHLALAYGGDSPSTGKWLDDFRQAFGVRVALLDEEEAAKLMAELSRVPSERPATMLYRLNNADFLREDAPAGSGMGLRFLANAAPIARQTLKTGTADRIDKGEVLHFEAIAHLSTGAERLGVLKADVDHLGQIFGEGLSSETFRPTIVRYAALSGALDIFFSGWLNDLCADVSADWETAQAGLPENEQHEWMGQTDGLFYVMYSGGDDLFIIGPWDAVLTLAERLQASWADYACLNRNVTLSAGIVLAKPHYPVHRFADEVDAALEAAKDAGRDRITVFSRTVRWSDMTPGYVELMKLGRDLCDEVKAGQVPRTLVHDLGRLERQHRDTRGDGKLKPMLTPRLYYTLARRLPKEVRERLGLRLLKAMNDILIPVSYVSLATRKE
jgi:CRISPR-associated protein Csm1